MNNMERRLKTLEKKTQPDCKMDDVIIVRFITPASEQSGADPDSPAAGWALIRSGPNAGMTLHPCEGETWGAFKQRVDKAKIA